MKKTAEAYVAQQPLVPVDPPTMSIEPVRQQTSVQPRSMLDMVMDAAMSTDLDPARLEKFLSIARDLELDKKKQEWATAFRAAKDEIDCYKITKRGQIVYEGKGGKQGGVVKFIRYDDIAKAVKPILQKHSLSASYTYRYEQTPPKAICVMTLLHANGYSQTFESIPLPMVDSSGGKNDVQGAGSVMSYGRRYAVCGAFDIVAESEDNNGSPQTFTPITPDQADEIEQFVKECVAQEPDFRRRFMRWLASELRAESIPDIFQGEPHKIVLAKLAHKMRDLGL
jgi:ERF superfamily